MLDIDSPSILIVEDEPDIARSFERILSRRLRARVTWAPTIRDARAVLSSNTFDLVTLDFQLPDGDGLGLLEEIVRDTDAAPVVMVTGHGDEDVASTAFKLGAVDYVRKNERLSSALVEAARRALSDEKLRKAAAVEQQYRDLFHSLRAGFVRSDAEGKITEANPACVRMHGYTEDELKTMNYRDLIADRSLAVDREELEKELQANCSTEIHEMEHRRVDGTVFPVDVQEWLITGEDGVVVGRWALVRDITTRVAARRKIEEQAGILDNINDAVVCCDADMRLTSWNRGAEQMFGYAADEVLGRPTGEVLGSEAPAGRPGDNLFDELRKTGTLRCETVHFQKDGTPVPVELTAWCLRDGCGRITGYAGVNHRIRPGPGLAQ
ncbi:MAG: PAS domain-containing protein [Candidatus Geothermincolia bacterium]